MKITRLNLARFRSYLGTTLDLSASRILIAGVNGTGKTSVREAIKWGLTGRCEGTDGKGAGAEVLVPEGSKDASVVLTLDKIGTVERSYGLTGGGSLVVENVTGTSQIQQQALYIKLDTTPAFLDAVMDTETFLKLNHIDGKALVLSLLGVKFDLDGASVSLDQLDAKYKAAFEDRKFAKKTLQNVFIAPAPATVSLPPVEKIEAQLKTLRDELGQKRQAIGATTGRLRALTEEADRLAIWKVDGQDVSAQIANLETGLAMAEQAVTPVPQPGDPKRLVFLRNVVESLQRHDPKNGCVFDSKIPCKTPLAAFTSRQADFNAELKAMDPRPAAPQESPLTTLRKELADLQAQQARFEASTKNAREADARLVVIRAEVATLPDTSVHTEEIATLEGRIQKGVDLLNQARAHHAAVGAYEDSMKAKKAAEAEVERLETLVEQLGPKGIRVKALEDAMGRFQAAVNPFVAPFGWTITFTVDPWEVFANGRPVETYSKSERFRIGIALQMGIAQLSGLNFVIIDELDMLTVANRQAVTQMILKAPLDQIIIIGSREDSQALPKVPDLICYRLSKNGSTTVVAEGIVG